VRIAEDNDLWWRISWRHHIHQVEEILFRIGRATPD